MNRNLHSRVEVVFPVYDNKLKEDLEQILQLQLGDTKKAVLIKANYSHQKILPPAGQTPFAAQEAIYQYVKALNSNQS